MATIQEVGLQILQGTPGQFYVFCGTEYGVKLRYIDILTKHYNGNCVNASSVNEVLNLMRKKRLIPLDPTVYVVRYDDEFLSSLSDKTGDEIAHTNIAGTLVCIYEQPKHQAKVMKLLPQYSVAIDQIAPQFVVKYLSEEFPTLDGRYKELAAQYTHDYNEARLLCMSLSHAPKSSICNLSNEEIAESFGLLSGSTEVQIKQGVLSRNFNYLMQVLGRFEGDLATLYYTILSSMMEADKFLDGKASDYRKYANIWSYEDVYHMFVYTYNELKRSRSSASGDVLDSLVYLFSLLRLSPIPAPEVLQ